VCGRINEKGENSMNKRRWIAMVIFSPIILTVLVLMVIGACIGYAVNGKWELKEMVNQFRTA